MSKEILTTKHKTPIQYTSDNSAKSAYHRVFRKGIKLLFAKYGFTSSISGRQVNLRFTQEQYDNANANNIREIAFKKIRIDYYYSRYRRSGWVTVGRYYFADNIIITEFLNDLYDDIKKLAKLAKSKPILKVEKNIKPRKTKAQKEEIKAQEQVLFNDAWKRQR